MRYGILAAYVVSIVSVVFIPIEHLRDYNTFWAAATFIVGLYFVLGFLRFAPWPPSEEGANFLLTGAFFVWAMGLTLFARITVDPRPVDPELRTYLVLGVVTYISLFYLVFWRASLFTRRQIASRRERKALATEGS